MRQLLILFALILLLPKLYAQTVDLTCPNIEWIKEEQPEYYNYTFRTYENPIMEDTFWVAARHIGSFGLGNFNIVRNHSRPYGMLMNMTKDGQITWLLASDGYGGSGFSHHQHPIRDKDNNIHAIFWYNQTTTFNGQTYVSLINNNNNGNIEPNSDHAIITLNANKQTTNFFTVPNMRIDRFILDTLGNKYVLGSYLSTITLGNQSFTKIGSPNNADAILFKLNTQNQVIWTVLIMGKGHERMADIAIDEAQNVYILADFNSDTLQVGNLQVIDTARTAGIGTIGYNMLLAKVTTNGTVLWTEHVNAKRGALCSSRKMQLANNKIYILGQFAGTIQLNNQDITSVQYINSYKANTILLQYNPTNRNWSYLHFKTDQTNASSNNCVDLLYNPHDGHLYVNGRFRDTLFLAEQIHHTSTMAVYFIRINPALEKLQPSWLVMPKSTEQTFYTGILSVDNTGALYTYINYQNDLQFLNKALNSNTNLFTTSHLKLVGLNKAVHFDGTTYTAVETQATTYQWLDCNNNMQPIPGATNRIFTPDQPGSYAVQMSNGACQVVSECLGTTSLPQTILAQTQIFPNPFDQSISIQVPPTLAQQELHLQVTDLLGKTIWSHKGKAKELNEKLQTVSQRWPSNQIYQIQITIANTNESATYKIIKQ